MPTSVLAALAKEATLGTAGDSPPALPSNATGILGFIRWLADLETRGQVQLGTSATGSEYSAVLAGLDTAGILRAAAVDTSGRVATRDASDSFAAPTSHIRKDLTTASTVMLAADVNRRYVEIQNVHDSEDIYFLLGAGSAALTLGDRLRPGMSWSGYYTGAIQGIAPAANRTAMLSVKTW
jgi:hypothetical protein